MKKLMAVCVALFCVSILSTTGCGGGSDNTVIEKADDAGLSSADQAAYEQQREAERGKAKPAKKVAGGREQN